MPIKGLRKCEIVETDFRQCSHQESKIEKSNLQKSLYRDCVFSAAKITNCNISETDFALAQMSETKIEKNNIFNSKFIRAIFPTASILKSVITKSDFTAAWAKHLDFFGNVVTDCNFHASKFIDSTLYSNTFSKCHFKNARWEKVQVRNVNLSGCVLKDSSFFKTGFCFVSFRGADLRGVRFDYCSFDVVDFTDCIMDESTIFINCNRRRPYIEYSGQPQITKMLELNEECEGGQSEFRGFSWYDEFSHAHNKEAGMPDFLYYISRAFINLYPVDSGAFEKFPEEYRKKVSFFRLRMVCCLQTFLRPEKKFGSFHEKMDRKSGFRRNSPNRKKMKQILGTWLSW